MDKNTLLGLLLMGLVIFGFMWLNQPDQQKLQETEQAAAIDRQQKEAAEAERTAARRAAAGEYSFDIGEAMRIMEQNTDE